MSKQIFALSFIVVLTLLQTMSVFASDQIQIKKISSALSSPVGMAFDSKGDLYIANWGAGRIDRYSSGKLGTFISDIASPSGLAIDRNDALYIATYNGGVIYKIENGKRTIFLSGMGIVAGLYFDDIGNLLVAERGKSRILSVSPEGQMSILLDKGLTTPVAAIQVGKNRYVINDITGTTYLYEAKTGDLKAIGKTLQSPAVGLCVDPSRPDSVLTVDYGDKGLYRISFRDGKSELLIDTLVSPVGLAYNQITNQIFVATWGDNSLYELKFRQ